MPEIAGQGMVNDGYRFRPEARLGGKLYGDPFGVDIGFADVLTAQPDLTQGSRFFEFAGIEPATFRLYPRHAHIAEKLHAYTMPRDRTNTRVKDLPDIALLASVGPIDALELRRAIDATFSFRGTHPVLDAVQAPASEWAPVYERMAREDELPWVAGDASPASKLLCRRTARSSEHPALRFVDCGHLAVIERAIGGGDGEYRIDNGVLGQTHTRPRPQGVPKPLASRPLVRPWQQEEISSSLASTNAALPNRRKEKGLAAPGRLRRLPQHLPTLRPADAFGRRSRFPLEFA